MDVAMAQGANWVPLKKTRLLGTIGVLASPMLLIESARSGFDTPALDRVNAVLGLVFLVGWACSMIGLSYHRAMGMGARGIWIIAVQGVGLVLAALQQIQDLMFRHPNTESALYQVANTAWPLSVLFMLVVGGVVARARVWSGWRRWSPLLCGISLPLLLGTMGVAGRYASAVVFGFSTTVAWALLGWAVATPPKTSNAA
jgi:hypothetical protein